MRGFVCTHVTNGKPAYFRFACVPITLKKQVYGLQVKHNYTVNTVHSYEVGTDILRYVVYAYVCMHVKEALRVRLFQVFFFNVS